MSRREGLACPTCARTEGLEWKADTEAHCVLCRADFSLIPLARFSRPRPVARPQAVRVDGEAVCYFHAANQAEKVCEACGRFLCPVCAVPYTGRLLCPPCIKSGREKQETMIPHRTLYGNSALALAFFPLLAWPFTCVTAPAALALAIYGWRQPRSLVAPGRSKLLLAAFLAFLQIGGWLTGLGYLLFAVP